MHKQDLVNHLQNDIYCRIKPSPIHGIGVFAIKDIPKGTNPFNNCNPNRYYKIKLKELQKLNPEVMTLVKDFFAYTKTDAFIPSHGLNAIDISFYMNQSDKPNCLYDHQSDTFTATRSIKKGEELTIDYNKF